MTERKLPLLGDASPWLHDAVSTFMATFSGEDASFVQVVGLLVALDERANNGDADAERVLSCVKQFNRLVKLAKRMGEKQ